jgi:hypothetical protein
VLTDVCQQLDLHDLVRVAETCKRFRHGDGGPKMVELPTRSPVVTALRPLAFSRPELVPRTRPIGISESWVAYLTRCVRQRRCRQAPPFAVGKCHTVWVLSPWAPFGAGAAEQPHASLEARRHRWPTIQVCVWPEACWCQRPHICDE